MSIMRNKCVEAASLLAKQLNIIGSYLLIQLITFNRSASRLTASFYLNIAMSHVHIQPSVSIYHNVTYLPVVIE